MKIIPSSSKRLKNTDKTEKHWTNRRSSMLFMWNNANVWNERAQEYFKIIKKWLSSAWWCLYVSSVSNKDWFHQIWLSSHLQFLYINYFCTLIRNIGYGSISYLNNMFCENSDEFDPMCLLTLYYHFAACRAHQLIWFWDFRCVEKSKIIEKGPKLKKVPKSKFENEHEAENWREQQQATQPTNNPPSFW